MLYGVDISNYQRSVEYSKYAFYIIKASEGRTCKDPMLDKHYNAVKAAGKPYGFYHYARPENNSWKAEADHFLSLVGHHAHKAIFALDLVVNVAVHTLVARTLDIHHEVSLGLVHTSVASAVASVSALVAGIGAVLVEDRVLDERASAPMWLAGCIVLDAVALSIL